jgi:hypothetical protein
MEKINSIADHNAIKTEIGKKAVGALAKDEIGESRLFAMLDDRLHFGCVMHLDEIARWAADAERAELMERLHFTKLWVIHRLAAVDFLVLESRCPVVKAARFLQALPIVFG